MTEEFSPPQLSNWAALWRIIAFAALWIAGSSLALAGIAAVWPSGAGIGIEGQIADALSELVGALLASAVLLRFADRSGWTAIGLGKEALSPMALSLGAALGGGTIALASLVLLGTHQMLLRASPATGWLDAAGLTAVLLLPAAFAEELVMRGYVFWIARRKWGWKWAAIGTSIFFGLLHIFNPGANAQSLSMVIIAGLFLAGVFLLTRSLYAAGVCHFAWNWVMAGGLHTPVSGQSLPAPNYTITDNGPDWLTGGRWGPEGGAAAGAAMIIIIWYLYTRHLRRMES